MYHFPCYFCFCYSARQKPSGQLHHPPLPGQKPGPALEAALGLGWFQPTCGNWEPAGEGVCRKCSLQNFFKNGLVESEVNFGSSMSEWSAAKLYNGCQKVVLVKWAFPGWHSSNGWISTTWATINYEWSYKPPVTPSNPYKWPYIHG